MQDRDNGLIANTIPGKPALSLATGVSLLTLRDPLKPIPGRFLTEPESKICLMTDNARILVE